MSAPPNSKARPAFVPALKRLVNFLASRRQPRAQAFEKLSHQKFDVLVSDIGMPGEDGCSLMRRVRAADNPVGAIALTAYANDGERDRALTSGFQS